MKKRVLAALLVLVLCSVFVGSAYALEMQPRAALSVDGGLVRNSGSSYYLWVGVYGSYEYKAGTSSLYRQSGSDWVFVTSVTTSGYDTYLYNDKTATLSSGYYKVVSTAASSSHSTNQTRYYNI